MQHIRAHVLVCGGTGCKSAGSKEVQLEFAKQLEQKGLSDEVMIVETGCHGFCEHGPLVIIYPEGTFYCRVKPEDVEEIVESHLFKGRIVENRLRMNRFLPIRKLIFIKSKNAWCLNTAAPLTLNR